MSLRDDILAVKDAKVVTLHVPEWDTTVHIRVVNGAERDRFSETAKNLANFRGRFAAVVLSDEKGNRIFTDQDAVALGQKAGTALERILDAGLALNKMRSEDVDDLEKKSASDQSVDSGTASP